MPASIHDGGHDDLEQRIEAGDRVFGGVGLREWGEVANIDNITVTSRRSPVNTSSPCSSSRAANAGST